MTKDEIEIAAQRETIRQLLEEREAFRREVSDAVNAFNKRWASAELRQRDWEMLLRFIIPEPDPLVDAINDVWNGEEVRCYPADADALRKALAARGYRIEKVTSDE